MGSKNNMFIISDEIYEKLIYDDNKHISIAFINEDIKINNSYSMVCQNPML